MKKYLFTLLSISGSILTMGPPQIPEKTTPIHNAIRNKELTEVKRLLKLGLNPNAKYNQGQTAQHIAAETQWEEALKLLLEKKASPDMQNNQGQTAVHIAGLKGPPMAFMALTMKKADLNLPDKTGKTALHYAAMNNDCPEECMQHLIDHGAIPIEDKDGKLPKEYLNLTKLHKRLFKLDIVKKMTPREVQNLITRYGSVKSFYLSSQDGEGRTLFHLSAEVKNKPMYYLLKQNGANATITDHSGKTPVDYWPSSTFNEQNSKGETELHMFVRMNSLKKVKNAIDKWADPNIQDNKKQTPLHLSAQMVSSGGSKAIYNYIKNNGGDPTIKDKNDKTPEDYLPKE